MMGVKDSPHSVFEASELGWAPGVWPAECEVEGIRYRKLRADYHEGELIGVEYRSDQGAELLVVND